MIDKDLIRTLRDIAQVHGHGIITDVARKMGRSYSTISKWMSGDRMPSLEEYDEMLGHMGYRFAWAVVPEDEVEHLARLRAVLERVPAGERERFLTALEAGVGHRPSA